VVFVKKIVFNLIRVVSITMALVALRKLYNVGIGGCIIVSALSLVWSMLAYTED